MPLSFLTDELPAELGAPEARPSATPHGRMETLPGEPPNRARLIENLPPPDTKRWVVRRKAAVVAAVRGGGITMEEACRYYQLSEEEFLSWGRAFEKHGLAGLRTTRVQQYRTSRLPRR
jgi:transposase-like protein